MKSVLVLQLEDRTNNNLNIFMNENKQICINNNIKYIFLEKSSFNVPAYWGKIFEIDKLMDEYPDIEYFMWLDSDAFFINFDNNKFQNFLKKYESYSMIITNDMPPFDAEFNAGSFIIKNNKYGHDIIKEWTSFYNPNKWEYKDLTWRTESAWAGEEYEQGSFIKYILHNPKFNTHIINLPYYYLNNNNCENNIDTITTHLAGIHKEDDNILEKCFKIFKYKEGFDENIIYDYRWLFILLVVIIYFYYLII